MSWSLSINRLSARVLALIGLAGAVGAATSSPQAPELWRHVEIIRTAHGVPHVRAENLRAGGYGLAWVMSEDYGPRTGMRLVGARGELSRFEGRPRVDADFTNLRARARVIATYHLLDPETRDLYDGFAAGINRYVQLNPKEFPDGMPADFSGYDVATLDVGDGPPSAKVRRFLAAVNAGTPPARAVTVATETEDADEDRTPEDGSNAWALAPNRTKSGRAILLRNPHLAWTAGYYEAHLTVPGVVDFYGDFRIGGPLIVIGGFNWHLGWATTNSNSGDLSEIYALELDPKRPDHYRLDGATLPLGREQYTVTVKEGEGFIPDMREFWTTPIGPVVHRTADRVFIVRTAGDGEFRAGEQFLRMMRARSLAEWKDAMRIRALVTSNYTYADRAGNILALWNTSLPWLPHPVGGDAATPVRETRDLWTRYVPFDTLPQVLNPRGGYVHNENDSPHFANVREKVDLVNAYPNVEPPMLRLRSQHAIELIGNGKKVSLEDVIRLKHSYRMLLADRVKVDLVAAVRATRPSGDVADAIALLQRWNNTATPDSRGAMLFEIWYQRYSQGQQPPAIFTHVWSEADPLKTPRGLADPARAAEAFAWAVQETARRHGQWDVAWGEVHRVRRGSVDVAVGGCSGALGCFRVLSYGRDPDGKLVANSGDGWVLAVEFSDTPRAYSVLAYGQSPDPESPWHADQAAMFARGEMKKVAFTAREVDAQAVTRYRPGEK
ncbi:MAG TPA: penicillin acylase family protein [Vicinamibacterales bacterium]|nr:penicillin acylase family protein [Vicinamibacterales bacterium]